MTLKQVCPACGRTISMVQFELKETIICPHCYEEVPADYSYASDEDIERALEALEESKYS